MQDIGQQKEIAGTLLQRVLIFNPNAELSTLQQRAITEPNRQINIVTNIVQALSQVEGISAKSGPDIVITEWGANKAGLQLIKAIRAKQASLILDGQKKGVDICIVTSDPDAITEIDLAEINRLTNAVNESPQSVRVFSIEDSRDLLTHLSQLRKKTSTPNR